MANTQKRKFLEKHKDQQATAVVSVNDRFPKFSFEFCFGSERGINKSAKKTKQAVIDKIIILSQRTWQNIKALPREQGFEKVAVSSFNSLPNVPAKFNDEDKVTVFRLPSDIGRLIGFIEEDTFFVVWIDTKFNMYNH